MLREVERISVSATAYSFRDSATRKPVRLTRLVYRGFSNSTDATGRGSCGQRRKWRVPLGRDKGLVGEEQEGKLEAIFFLPQIERSFTALHYAFDRIPHFVNVDCALASDRPARLVADRPVVAPRNKLCVAVYDEIRVVAGEYELSLSYGGR